MKLNRTSIFCCISLLLVGFTGCKKVVKVNVEKELVPVTATVAPGNTLEWVATSPDEKFDVVFQSGLCAETSPLHATYEHPAICTIPKQPYTKNKEPIIYTYHLEGQVGGKPVVTPQYSVQVGPGGCPHCK